jgi:hypothetical protein
MVNKTDELGLSEPNVMPAPCMLAMVTDAGAGQKAGPTEEHATLVHDKPATCGSLNTLFIRVLGPALAIVTV